MSTLNCIDYKIKRKTKGHTFGLFMLSKSLFAGNIFDLQHLNRAQMDVEKRDIC